MKTLRIFGMPTARTATWSKTAAVPLRLHGATLKQRRSRLELKLPPVVLGAIAAALMWIASSVSPAFAINFPANFVSSASLALIGALTCLAGVCCGADRAPGVCSVYEPFPDLAGRACAYCALCR